ncbi:MAG: hypothetical protein VKP62_14460 [Candidatus Sericytochromatia bacterium]|nr:hypothetical protein [Candidatus Sericytochromatia bacterium]
MNPAAPAPPRWIVGPGYDGTFFIGAAALTFVFLGLYEALKAWGLAPSGPAALLTYFAFTALLDLPHIFQTFARTHADPVEFARRRPLYTWGLPLVMAAGLLVPALGLEAPFTAFLALYGSHHIIRQHVGFLRVYQGLNEPVPTLDQGLDRLAFELGLYACVLHEYAAEFGDAWTRTVPVYGKWVATYPTVPAALVEGLTQLAALVLGAWLLRQLYRAALGERLNGPKIALMLAALSTHYVVFLVASVPFLVAEAIETAYHDAQYHGWMMHYQRRRFPAHARIVLKWGGAALAYGLLAGTIEVLGYTQDLFYWVFAPLGMLTLFHYYIDGRIWRFREQPELRSLLHPAT